MGEVWRLFRASVHRQPMQEVEEVLAVENRGLEGCIHGRPGSGRQILLMDVETLARLGLQPGIVKENITTCEVALYELSPGRRLGIGQSVLEITGPCEPCHLMDEIRAGLKQELCGQRGMLCRGVQGGWIRRGNKIEVLELMRVGR